jgi:hypothetical protein
MNNESFSKNETTERKTSREVADRAAAELSKIKRASSSLGSEITTYVKKQPMASIGIALGTGFVLGSVLGTRLGRIALVAAAGYAAQELAEAALGKGGVRQLLVQEVQKLANASERTAS